MLPQLCGSSGALPHCTALLQKLCLEIPGPYCLARLLPHASAPAFLAPKAGRTAGVLFPQAPQPGLPRSLFRRKGGHGPTAAKARAARPGRAGPCKDGV